jgi:branched-chain amino acid transport system substrate-binding protein
MNERHSGRVALVGVAACFAVAACGSSASSTTGATGGSAASGGATTASGQPIVIGDAEDFTGQLAFAGPQFLEGAQLAADVVNKQGGALGRPLQIVQADAASSGNGMVTAVRTLNSQGVNFLVGGTLTAECTAAIPLLQSLNMIELSSGCQQDALTGPSVNKNFFRIWANASAAQGAIGSYACKTWPSAKRIDTIFTNDVTGHLQHDTIAKVVSSCGMTPGTEIFIPATTTSELAYVQQFLAGKSASSSTDSLLIVGLAGTPAPDFFKSGMSLGLFNDYAATLETSPTYPSYVKALQPNVPTVYAGNDWDITLDSPGNQTFIAAYKAAHGGALPTTNQADSYNSVLAYAAAINKAGSTDPAAVLKALEGITFQGTQQSQVKIDPTTHQGNSDQVIIQYTANNASKVVDSVPYGS